MKTFQIVMGIITLVLLFCTTVCGLWLHGTYGTGVVPESSIRFHMTVGIATAICTLVTVATLFFRKK